MGYLQRLVHALARTTLTTENERTNEGDLHKTNTFGLLEQPVLLDGMHLTRKCKTV
jgi:hypothetical protein